MSVGKLKSGHYRARIQKRKKGIDESRTFPTQTMAKQWELKKRAEIFDFPLNPTENKKKFSDALHRYLEEVIPKKKSFKSLRYVVVSLLKEKIAEVPLNRLTTAHIAAWRDEYSKTASSDMLTKRLSVIKRTLHHAKNEWKWMRTQPAAGIPFPERAQERNRRFTEEEITKIVQFCKYTIGTLPETLNQQTAAALLLGIETAMRQSEMTGLRWSDVFFSERYVHLEETKNGKSRDVPLSFKAVEILKTQQGLDTERVFTVTAQKISTNFMKIVRKLSLVDLHFHDSRREACCRLAKIFSIMELAKITGHTDLNVLARVYYAPTNDDILHLLDKKTNDPDGEDFDFKKDWGHTA